MYEKKVKVNTKTIDSLSLDQVNEMLNNLKVIESVEEDATETVQSNDQSIQSDNKILE